MERLCFGARLLVDIIWDGVRGVKREAFNFRLPSVSNDCAEDLIWRPNAFEFKIIEANSNCFDKSEI